MSGTVCYLERATGGSLIRRVRLVSPGQDRSWIADVPSEQGGGGAPGSAVAPARAAARWVAEQLGRGRRELGAVCLDPEGGLCVWLSAPSSNESVVTAAMLHAKSAAFDAGDLSAAGVAGMTPTGPLAAAAEGSGFNRSVQALADPVIKPQRSGLLSIGRRSKATQHGAESRRMGVLSIPDAPVRVFLDELDTLGVTVGSVESLWHAIAGAWDPGAGRGGEERESDHGREAASVSPCSAVVVVDPSVAGEGRLVWSWSSGGELIAGGTMRVMSVTRAAPEVAEPAEAGNGAARRLPAPAARAEAEAAALCGPSEVGRLVADWLAWGAQLGKMPTRVVCVGPTAHGPIGLDSGTALAEALVRAWPGATVDAAAAPDPIGATLARRAAIAEIGSQDTGDPRAALVALSQRPGRVHRGLYQWAALATLAGAVVIGVVGWRASHSAALAREQAEKLRTARKELLIPLDKVAPGVSASEVPLMVLNSALQKLKYEHETVQHEFPVLREFARVLEALENREGLRLDEVSIYSISGTVTFTIPEADALTGPAVTLALKPARLPTDAMRWRGQDKRGLSQTGSKQWELLGAWPERTRTSSAGGGSP